MKAVLLSIRPEWCEKIINESPLGRKNVEIRKTRPKLKRPFKCFIYCTKAKSDKEVLTPCNDHTDVLNGKVLGEFICDEIVYLDRDSTGYGFWHGNRFIYIGADNVPYKNMTWNVRMPVKQIDKCLGMIRGYGWHISDLIVYDKPKSLSDFTPFCRGLIDTDGNCLYGIGCEHQQIDRNSNGSINAILCGRKVQQPPQSWCYVLDATW